MQDLASDLTRILVNGVEVLIQRQRRIVEALTSKNDEKTSAANPKLWHKSLTRLDFVARYFIEYGLNMKDGGVLSWCL